jgi:UPF0755 protein
MMRRLLLAGCVLGLCGVGAAWLALRAYESPGPLRQDLSVVVPHGSYDDVARALRASGVIGRPAIFRAFSVVTAWQGPLRAAELRFPAGASLEQVLRILRFGRPIQHLLTIAEGVTSAKVALLLADASALRGDVTVPAEGSVLPQTYAYEMGMTRSAVLARAQEALRRVLADEWPKRDADVPLHSAQDAVVLASIVERETALARERPLVARVFYNRLRLGMRLQSDPTVVYGVSGGFGVLTRALTRADLQAADAPYSTYALAGLPPGPICNPGRSSIEAVLHPAASEALYFVADGSGGHAFSDSLAEHERNVRRMVGREVH